MTAPTIDTTPAVDQLEALDWDVACQWGHLGGVWDFQPKTPCDTPARWATSGNCCGAVDFRCDPHLHMLLQAKHPVKCIHCGRVWPTGAAAVGRIEPLR